MRVGGTRSSKGMQSGRAIAPRRGAGAFALQTAGAPATIAAARPVHALDGIEALLALQGVGDVSSGRRKAVKRGARLLDCLDELRLAILGGRIPRAQLKRLVATLAEKNPEDLDPELAELLNAIELRAEVELAKLERSAS